MTTVDAGIEAAPTRARGLGWFGPREGGRVRPMHWLLLAGVYAFFAVFLILPIVMIVATGFRDESGGFTLKYLGLILADPNLLRGLLNSLIIAVSVTALSLLLALPLAVFSVRYTFPLRGLFSGLLLVPLILPPFVGAIGMKLVLSRMGPLTQVAEWFGLGGPTGIDWLGMLRMLGVILVETLSLYPIMLLNVQAALANIDPAMEQAASNLGASASSHASRCR